MTENPHPHRVELLAPAGSREALVGAFSAGADAVYLGGERFGARAYADNFTTEEIIRSIGEAHVLGRKIYLTANVLTREDELPELVRFVEELCEAGLDGAIVQDIGVLSALHEACPSLPLHASTQMSVTSADAVRLLRSYGVSRVVPARELSLEEIRILRAEDAAVSPLPIEIEAFIHGAMCYSYSGRCLMSSFLGGRSGNRGRCAGTCRLPYRILDENRKPAGPDARKKETWPLSMKDMCVLSILPELIDAGIDSFKIEGRMKKPVYPAGVTAIYRKYIDRCYEWTEAGRKTPWKVEEDDLERLRSLYIRTALGTGYYHTKNGRNLVTIGKPGYAGTDAELEEEIRRKYLGRLPRREISGKAVFRTGEPARLTLTLAAAGPPDPAKAAEHGGITKAADPAGSVSVECTGAVVQSATGSPLTEEGLLARLRKTGDSLFTFSTLEIEADENIFMPVSAINTLRRESLAQLQEKILQTAAPTESGTAAVAGQRTAVPAEPETAVPTGQRTAVPAEPETAAVAEQRTAAATEKLIKITEAEGGTRPQELWALVSTRAQMEAAASSGCACILADGDFEPIDRKKIRYICVLPPVFRVSYRERIIQDIQRAQERGYSGILVRTLEELSLVLQTGYRGEIIADASLYSWNGRSLSALAKDCTGIVCSLELSRSGILDAVRAAGGGEPDAVMQKIILPVYGRIPMMESAGCVRRTENLCSKKDGFWYLEDRRGMQLPVRCRCGICSNTIYNAVPLSLHQFAGRGLFREAPVHLCMFTTEDAEETRRILRYFASLQNRDAINKKGRAASEKNAGRPPFEQFTNGHYKTGAL